MPAESESAPPGRRVRARRPRTHDPKTFGAIPGVAVGATWESREGCSDAAVHGPWIAGIAGTAACGAYSIALSGGYEDDVDLGYTFTYTGAGGRQCISEKRPGLRKNFMPTAPHSYDQTFENSMNAALKKSVETQKPVRVIRGYKLASPYAPKWGYRYDGLYVVEKAWREEGKDGFKVCRYRFTRIQGQALLPGTEREEVGKMGDLGVKGEAMEDVVKKEEEEVLGLAKKEEVKMEWPKMAEPCEVANPRRAWAQLQRSREIQVRRRAVWARRRRTSVERGESRETMEGLPCV